MPPPDEGSATGRGRRRSHHACLPCRRKKTRCPAEKPACSSCTRLHQPCSYPPPRRPSHSSRSEERLVHLEEKLDRLLTGRSAAHVAVQDPNLDNSSAKSLSVTPPAATTAEGNISTTSPSTSIFESDPLNNRPASADIAAGIGLYFKYCHRQPVWLFDRDEANDHTTITDELACSILALTARFSPKPERLAKYGNNARNLIMGCIASGRVGLATLESVCLLSYSSFIDGNVHLGQFHLGLALQLCQSARLDHDTAYSDDDPLTERKKRLFWSLQILDHYHGQQPGILSMPSDIWPLEYHLSSDKKHHLDQDVKMPPPFPLDDIGHSQRSEPGIWNTSVYLGSVWSKVRTYVSNCSRGVFKEPWRRDSMYAMVVSDFMEVENRIPMRHRYDSVKFYERKVEELRVNRDYWTPWLKEQFTYHAIPAVLNHPFLYIVGAQHNPNLAIPHTFWRRSSELALIHSTWITRLIDMVMDKQVLLIDPFFGHIAAIAATVHLYYCCAAAPKLKHKSNTDFAKCRRFLKSFLPFSPACAELDRNLDKMAKIAAGSESNDVEDWMPSHIYLSVPLMWKLLQFNCTTDPQDVSAAGLLTASLASTAAAAETDEGVTLDIIVATSPEISVNTADGGQDAPTLPYSAAPVPATPQPSATAVAAAAAAASASRLGSGVQALTGDVTAECPDSLTFNTTPWLYAEGFPSQFDNIGNMDYDMSDSGSNTGGGDQLAWWQTEFHTGFV